MIRGLKHVFIFSSETNIELDTIGDDSAAQVNVCYRTCFIICSECLVFELDRFDSVWFNNFIEFILVFYGFDV